MKNYLKFSFFLLLSVLIFSCVREESESGLTLQDPNTIINGHRYDTTVVDITTIYADSIYTQKLASAVIGYYGDASFGSVNASLYTQVQFESQKKPDLEGYKSLDSLILSLSFSGFYPKTYDTTQNSAKINIEVFQLSENLQKDHNYLPSDVVGTVAPALWSGQVSFAPTDSVTVDGKKQPAQIRVKLPDAFMRTVVETNWATNDDFVNGIRGLYIRVNGTENKMGYFNMNSSFTGLTLFYKDIDNDRKTTRYIMDTSLVRFANYTHNYSGTPLSNIQNASIPGSSKIYLENLAGTRIKINFPKIIDWGRSKPYAINQAVLVLPISDEIDKANIPPAVYCYAYNSEGKLAPILDYYSSSGIYAAEYNSEKEAYLINLTRHVQNMLNGNYEDWGLLLISYAERTAASRVVLNGTSVSSDRARLEVIYTTPPEK